VWPGPYVEEPSAPRARAPLTILQINDVYSTVPVDGIGGLARVASLKRQLAQAGRTPLLVIAGDFLSPSVASSVFKGEQMVAALNAAGLDLAMIGNHEFDFGIDVLRQRMKESRFQWIVSNVVDTSGQPLSGTVPYIVRTFGSIKVGFIGLMLTTEEISPEPTGAVVKLIDPYEAAARYLPILKQQNVDVIVALTHLSIAEDRELVERFPEIDLIVGGHEHYPIVVTANRTLISKAGTDARFVARIDVDKRNGVTDRFFELIPMTAAIPDDPATTAVALAYERRLSNELDTVVGLSRVELDAERLRAGETNLGDLFADAIRASAKADVGLVNGGSIRGDRIYPAGAITRRTLIAMHPFGNTVAKIETTGRVLVDALSHGVSKLPATAGHFPQVSGLTMTVDLRVPVTERVKNLMVNGRPIDLGATYTLALPGYLLTGGDGYTMFGGSKVLTGPESGPLLTTAVERYLADGNSIELSTPTRITIVR